MRLLIGINGWIERGIHLATQMYGYIADDLIIPVQTQSVLSGEVYVHGIYSPLPFSCTDPSVMCKLFRTSSICLAMAVGDAGSPGDVEHSEGGEGELNVAMGERKKRNA
jgi:hypothetical protein